MDTSAVRYSELEKMLMEYKARSIDLYVYKRLTDVHFILYCNTYIKQVTDDNN